MVRVVRVVFRREGRDGAMSCGTTRGPTSSWTGGVVQPPGPVERAEEENALRQMGVAVELSEICGTGRGFALAVLSVKVGLTRRVLPDDRTAPGSLSMGQQVFLPLVPWRSRDKSRA